SAKACPRTLHGFTLVELLVVLAIMMVLMGLMASAVSAARGSQNKQATQMLIAKLDTIIQQQFATYASRNVLLSGSTPTGFPSKAAYRSWYIRRNLITGDLPDRWTDVAAVASGTTVAATITGTTTYLPLTGPQRSYASMYKSGTAPPSDQYAGAECLFMTVMQGGFTNCLDCGELKTSDRGDKDTDGAFEFWDAWGNPIGFILWPAGLELPAGTGTKFFSASRSLENPFVGSPSPALGMRPLIYSAGPDGEYGFNRDNERPTLTSGSTPVGRDCGNWTTTNTGSSAGAVDGIDYRDDNITNFDAEARK
ncbi:MAG: prepilin-type N-terminal cleavage/methylation domain-containing protein, partial [Pirellulales bacterium]